MKYYLTQAGRSLLEGKTTGGDTKATAERLGKWYKGINPKASRGVVGGGKYNPKASRGETGYRDPGYMRPRNVPPSTDEYDPTKHEAPEKGKPLRYMKPQHKDYAVGNIRKTIGKVATRKAERDTPKRGNIHQLAKSKKATFSTETEKGQDTLKKHGVPNPSLKDMYAKWMRGNSPQSKKNPEGYVRSDRK
tara:strand:- start:1729 stop:2301 length:573 start_codon:yes stop_codon:yes gene_type:complete